MFTPYLIPSWFFGFDIGMELLFFIITAMVALVAFRISRITKEKNVGLFGLAFLLIGISYAIWAAINIWFVHAASEGFREFSVGAFAYYGALGVYLYMGLFIAGLATLAYITCDSCSKGKIYYLLLGLSLLIIAVSFDKLVSFRILSAFLIFFIGYYYLEEYVDNRKPNLLGTFLAFLLLFLAEVGYIFMSYYYLVYVVGHILELSAYIIMLAILIKSVKK